MLIRGNRLTARQREQVLAAYVHRDHAIGDGKEYRDDADWVNRHAFYFLKDGSRLALNRHHCEPDFMGDN